MEFCNVPQSSVLSTQSFQLFEADVLKARLVRSFQNHRGRHTRVKSLFPAKNTEAPFIACFQAGKTPFGMRSDEIIPARNRELEKLVGHDRAHGVPANVIRSGLAVAVAIEAGHWRRTADLQLTPENILWFRPVSVPVSVGDAHPFLTPLV